MPKPDIIELNDGTLIPILFENRAVLAIDKPAGWMLVPFNWQKTNRNLHAAIVAAIGSGHYWAKSRGLKFLAHIHRLDAETTGILLLAKSRGALDIIGDLFETRQISKRYLAVVNGTPREENWTCNAKLSQDTGQIGRILIDPKDGKEAETAFRCLATTGKRSLIEARPVTGRTHQIRVHLKAAGLTIMGDDLYGSPGVGPRTAAAASPQTPGATARPRPPARKDFRPPMALRAINLSYRDPFTKAPVAIRAPFDAFVKEYGFDPVCVPPFQSAAKPPPPRNDPE